MILLFHRQFKDGRTETRTITNVVHTFVFNEMFLWQREGVRTHFGLEVEFIERTNLHVCGVCNFNDAAILGVGDGLIKWFVWNHVFVAELTDAEVQRHMMLNPVTPP